MSILLYSGISCLVSSGMTVYLCDRIYSKHIQQINKSNDERVNYYRRELTSCRNEIKKIVDTLKKRNSSSNEQVIDDLLEITNSSSSIKNTLRLLPTMGTFGPNFDLQKNEVDNPQR